MPDVYGGGDGDLYAADDNDWGVELMQQYRGVKRKAKVDEDILIIDAITATGSYKDGDILRVVRVLPFGVVTIYSDLHKGMRNAMYGEAYVDDTEYVVLEPIDKPIDKPIPVTIVIGDVLTVGSKSVKLTDEQLSALGMVTDAAKKRHDAMVGLNERLWRFAVENGGEPVRAYEFWTPCFRESTQKWEPWSVDGFFYPGDVMFRSPSTCRRAIDEIIIPFCKEHPELGL